MAVREDSENVARRVYEEIWQNHNFDAIDELIAEDYVLHDPSMSADEWPSGREGYRMMAEMAGGLIDGDLQIEQLVPAGDHVTVRWKQTGTHVGQLGGIEPTNEEVTITGIEINRFEDGKLAETWGEVGMLPMLIQVGAVPDDLFDGDAPAQK